MANARGRALVTGENGARLLMPDTGFTQVAPAGSTSDQSWLAPGMPGWDPAAQQGGTNGPGGPFWRPF